MTIAEELQARKEHLLSPDPEAEAVVRALLYPSGEPPRSPLYNAYMYKPGQPLPADLRTRARGRALSRLREAHRAEFDRYWREAEWDIYDGRAT